MSSSLGWRYKHSVDHSHCSASDRFSQQNMDNGISPAKKAKVTNGSNVSIEYPLIHQFNETWLFFLSLCPIMYSRHSSIDATRILLNLIEACIRHWLLFVFKRTWLTTRGQTLGQGFFIHSPLAGASYIIICSVERAYRAQSKTIWLAEYQLNNWTEIWCYCLRQN